MYLAKDSYIPEQKQNAFIHVVQAMYTRLIEEFYLQAK